LPPTQPIFTTPLIPRLFNILRVEKIPSGTIRVGQADWPRLRPLPRIALERRRGSRKVSGLSNNYGTTNGFPNFVGHFSHFLGVHYGKSRKGGVKIGPSPFLRGASPFCVYSVAKSGDVAIAQNPYMHGTGTDAVIVVAKPGTGWVGRATGLEPVTSKTTTWRSTN
jgi:hypothetical protein